MIRGRAVREMVPDARIVLAHGRMREAHLEKVMRQFVHREADILVTTTIMSFDMFLGVGKKLKTDFDLWKDVLLKNDRTALARMVRYTGYLNPRDAESRGIREGDRVRVKNDIGAFEIFAKLSETMRPGQIVVYHAWEPFQFPNHRSYQAVTPSPLNPIQMAGGYYHLQPYMTVGQPGMNDRGTRVEVEKI